MYGDEMIRRPESPSEEVFPSVLNGVYLWMFAGLAVSALSAWLTVTSQPLMQIIYGSSYGYIALIVIEFALVFSISAGIRRISATAAGLLFFLFAIVNGLTLSSILFVYDIGTIFAAFLAAGGMFGIMAVFGALTKRNLASLGGFLTMGLFGLIIASIVNLIIGSTFIDTMLCYAGIAVFVGLTAYDVQKIKNMMYETDDFETLSKIKIIGALSLYLDFVNIFLRLLRIMGRRSGSDNR